MIQIIDGTLPDRRFADQYAEQMFRLRFKVFHERLRWDVSVKDGLEVDQFDDSDSVYLLATLEQKIVRGGWRLRPTTRPYMMRDVFPGLLSGSTAPVDRRIWEISRFAVDTDEEIGRSFGFGEVSRHLVVETIRFAAKHNINQYVMVVSVAVERLLCGFGLKLQRFAPPQRIGRVMSVAVWLDIDAHARNLAFGEPVPLVAAA